MYDLFVVDLFNLTAAKKPVIAEGLPNRRSLMKKSDTTDISRCTLLLAWNRSSPSSRAREPPRGFSSDCFVTRSVGAQLILIRGLFRLAVLSGPRAANRVNHKHAAALEIQRLDFDGDQRRFTYLYLGAGSSTSPSAAQSDCGNLGQGGSSLSTILLVFSTKVRCCSALLLLLFVLFGSVSLAERLRIYGSRFFDCVVFKIHWIFDICNVLFVLAGCSAASAFLAGSPGI